MTTYYALSSDVSFQSYDGYYLHWYDVDPWQPDEQELYTWNLCYENDNGVWATEDGINCPN